jgi:tetratricopeptide (TPR) repeat protein
MSMAQIALFRGDFRQALDIGERRLKLASDGRNHPQMALSRNFLAFIHHFVGDWTSAKTLLKENLKPESHAGSVFTRLSTQFLRWLDGDWEAARDMLVEGLGEAEQEANVQIEFRHYISLINYSIDLEEYDAAVRWSREALQARRPYHDYPGFIPGAVVFAALALGLGGHLDEANEALAQAEVTRSEIRDAYDSLTRAVIQAKSDAWGQALQTLDQCISRFQGMGMIGEAAWAQWIFGRLLLAQDDAARRDQGRRLLGEALETYERIGATRYVEEIRKRLAAAGGETR